jgi:hypothetical protein
MSRIAPRITLPRWKLALPAFGLALTAAVHAHAGTTQTAPAAHQKAEVHQVAQHGREDAYALVGNDVSDNERGATMTGNSADWQAIKQLKRSIKGEFLWFRDGGKSWIVQDPDTLARARAAWAPVNRLDEQMNAYGKDMERHGKAMEDLGKQMAQAATGMQADPSRVRELQRNMNDLSREMASLGRQMGSASEGERERLARKMDGLGQRMSELGAQMGAAHEAEAQRRARAGMDEVGRRMNEAGKPMDELGKKMDALGKQMEQESTAADKTVRGLIRDALARGLAQQAPAQS